MTFSEFSDPWVRQGPESFHFDSESSIPPDLLLYEIILKLMDQGFFPGPQFNLNLGALFGTLGNEERPHDLPGPLR